MGKFDKLAKFLGLAPTEYVDDAAKLLEKVDTPELATSLKGDVREEYLKILDEIYGDQATRAKNMGFGKRKYYHGTPYNKPIDEFKNELLGKETTGISKKLGTHFSSNPSVASEYAQGTGQILPVNLKTSGAKAYYTDSSSVSPEDINLIKDAFNETNNKPVILRDKVDTPNNKYLTGDVAIVPKPEDIRSINAAFDPRFKNSPLLMAGAAAVPIDMSPIDDIKKGLGYYEQAKEAITKPLAQQLNIGKNPQDEKTFNSILKTGLDPANYVPGAAGAGLGAIQMLTPSDEEIQQQALQRLIDENR